MNKFYLFLTGLLLIAFFPLLADATTIKRTGTNVSLTADEVVEGNFYAVGNSVSITGEVEGDVVIAGGNVTVSGVVSEDALIIGGTVSLDSTVADDVRIIAGEVTISGIIDGSLSVVAGKINILSTTVITGDVMIYGSEAIIEGEIGGFVYGKTNALRIDGKVVSGIDITSGKLTLGNRSEVEGNITYISSNDLVRAGESRVGGTIVRNSPTMTEESFSFRPLAVYFLILLFTTLVFYLIARSTVERFVSFPMFNYQSALRAILLGFVFLFLPVAIAVLLASVLGILVGIVALLLYVLLLIITIPMMSLVVAKLVMKVFKDNKLTPMHIIIAVVAVSILSYVPYIGLLVFFGLYIFTAGVILSLLWKRIRRQNFS